MKKTLALTLACVLTAGLLLTGCGANSKTDGSADGIKQLAVQIGPNPETIDPALISTVDAGTMVLHAYEPLLTMDENNQVQPGQAETWEVSDDLLTWTFHLRDGLKWSDGSDLTAADFVYSWKRIVSPETAAPYSDTVLGMVKGFSEAIAGKPDALAVSAPDDKTFVVELAYPCSYFEKIAAFVTLCPVQQAAVEENGDAWSIRPESYISNGPFVLKEWTVDSNITLKKNPLYWNADAIKLDEIKFVLMEDSAAAFSAFQTGSVLLAKDVSIEEIPSLTPAAEGGSFYTAPLLGTYFLTVNTSLEQFQDVRVRQALSLSLDRKYIADILMHGTYSAAHSLIGPGITDADGSTAFMDLANGGKPYLDNSNPDANMETAKQLLAEAGYPDGQDFPFIAYLVNDSGYNRAVAEYVQAQWGQLGIPVDVQPMEWSSFTAQRRAGGFDIARNGFLYDYDNPSSILSLFITGNGNNDGRYSNPDYDAAMAAATTAATAEERFANLHKAEDILMADLGVIPLAYYNDFWLQSEHLVDTWHSPYGYFMLMNADIIE